MIGREEILRQLRKVQLIITAETELQVYAAGGCIRDMYFGLPAKDVDLIVPVGLTDEKAAFSVMERFARSYHAMFDEPVTITTAYNQSSSCRETLGDFDERLYGVVKIQSPLCEVDVLFSRYGNIAEVLSHFDCNLNTGYMNTLGFVDYAEPLELVWLKPVSPSRELRMLNKWAQIQGVRDAY